MITEHNQQFIWLVKAEPTSEENAKQFLHPLDAKRCAEEIPFFQITKIELPFRLEYQASPVHWQWQRYYRTEEAALEGFEDYTDMAFETWAGDCMWRIVDLKHNKIIAESIPNH